MANSVQIGQSVGGIEGATTAIAGVGTAQSGAAALPGAINIVSAASGQTAFVLPSNYPLNCPLYIINTSAVAGVVYPASGGSINGGSANASKALSANDTSVFIQYGTNLWGSALGA